ncbi:hypothetical protein FYC62_12925 [Pedobacter aquae]|uniref:DUF2147 domain-containing protein n=1 Tax=Pedobacter aquae TaxID=2605747 RepID=A0A5C0VID9_9SPHI|nr:hypothetical protein [Pedobacter aquae]QEK52455.1 hypothetical protein FYC62_12925 [Pedobacter aquae]
MKKVIIVLLSLIYSITAYSQDILAGIWKYQNNSEVFIVNIWKVTDGYRGHYKKITVDVNGNQVSVVYDSNKEIGDTGHNWPSTISAGSLSQDYSTGGTIYDNTVTNSPNAGGFIEGLCRIKILNPNCYNSNGNTCALQAEWMVKRGPGLYNPAEPPYSVPTNIILTKQ